MKDILLLLLCPVLFLASCGREEKLRRIDLIQNLQYADVSAATHVIRFGVPEGKKYLLSGWGDPERSGNETFQWAIEPNAAFFFNLKEPQPVYLHLKTSSFFENSAQVLVNKKPAGKIHIPLQADFVSIQLDANLLQEKTNVIELQFADVRRSPQPQDQRTLAASFYCAVITPAKYISGSPGTEFANLGSPNSLSIQNKKRSAITFPAGGTIQFYEKLSKDSVLGFASFYKPSSMSEEDDFAEFKVRMTGADGNEHQLYSKKSAEYFYDSEQIALSRYIQSDNPEIYRIEFRIDRNSILDSGAAAWVEPELFVKGTQQNHPDRKAFEKLRNSTSRANVVLIILDAAGAKHVSSYGYFRKTTPNIDQLSQQGIQFQHAYCQAVYTLASTASLMSGLDPINHRIILRRSRLPQETITIAERFLNSGYETGTFVSNGNASSIFGMTQGFREIAEVFREPNYSGWGKDITNRFTGWLDKGFQKPFFAYLHYREPHAPFNPPEEFKNQFTDPNYTGLKDASYERRKQINMGQGGEDQAEREYITATYDENLNYGDYEVGRVLSYLKQRGLFDNTMIIVTSDHGEAFWEHGFQGHNSQLYEESIRIPFVMKLPRNAGIAGKKVAHRVRTIDIYPTLVDLANLSRNRLHVDGKSFAPYLISSADDKRPVFSQIIEERGYSLIEDNYKFIIHLPTNTQELYDLQKDPQEKSNLIQQQPLIANYLRLRLFGWMSANKREGARQKTEKATIDDAARENLKALGYID